MFEIYQLTEFGKALKKIRANNGFTQDHVKKITGINPDTLRRIENGQVIPKYETLEILSSAYKIDLLIVLRKYRSNKQLTDLYKELDLFINRNDIDALINAKNQIDLFKADKTFSILIHTSDIQLLENFIDRSIDYFQDELTYDTQISNCICTLVNYNEAFELTAFKVNRYNYLELRVLILIGLLYVKNQNIIESNEILVFALDYLHQTPNLTHEEKNLMTKLYYNISYNYYRLNDYKKSLHYANCGIESLTKRNNMYCLSFLICRKLIAEYKLNLPINQAQYRLAIDLLILKGEKEIADEFIEIFSDKYHLSYP